MSSSPFQSPLPTKWVSADIIRQAFNDGQFWERAQRGELTPKITRDKHPEKPPYGEPVCTRKQFLVYHTSDGEPVAWVHQFLHEDRTLGASGKPDPKRLVVEGRMLAIRARQSKKRRAADKVINS